MTEPTNTPHTITTTDEHTPDEKKDMTMKMYTVQEIADSLSISENTIYKAISEGALSAARIGSRIYRLSYTDVYSWLDRCKNPARSAAPDLPVEILPEITREPDPIPDPTPTPVPTPGRRVTRQMVADLAGVSTRSVYAYFHEEKHTSQETAEKIRAAVELLGYKPSTPVTKDPGSRSRVTAMDVAKRAGVSIWTIYGYLENKRQPKMSASTQQRILDAMAELGYAVNKRIGIKDPEPVTVPDPNQDKKLPAPNGKKDPAPSSEPRPRTVARQMADLPSPEQIENDLRGVGGFAYPADIPGKEIRKPGLSVPGSAPVPSPSRLDANIVIVTRHDAIQQWLNEHGIYGRRIWDGARADDVRDKLVYGKLPVRLAYLARQYGEIEVPGGIQDGTTLEEMKRKGAFLRMYKKIEVDFERQ